MPIVMIGTNLIYMATKIYMIMFVCIVEIIHISYMLPKILTIIIKYQVL